MAAIQGISEDDLEDYLLERSEKFWDMIRRARRGEEHVARDREEAVSLDAFGHKIGLRLDEIAFELGCLGDSR